MDIEDVPDEPDWEKIPPERREIVRANWHERSKPEPRRWKLWGPQIETYANGRGFEVEVLGPCDQARGDTEGGETKC